MSCTIGLGKNMRIILDILIVVTFGITAIFLYQNYWNNIQQAIFGTEPRYTVYLGATALDVTLADEQSERVQGLSGVPSLRDFEGKLFIFDVDDKHGFWMKDMLIPIDIIWINKNLEVVYIEENVAPNSYPEVFGPPVDARFVLEMNAHFVSSLKVKEGDRIILPSNLLPADVTRDLQQ